MPLVKKVLPSRANSSQHALTAGSLALRLRQILPNSCATQQISPAIPPSCHLRIQLKSCFTWSGLSSLLLQLLCRLLPKTEGCMRHPATCVVHLKSCFTFCRLPSLLLLRWRRLAVLLLCCCTRYKPPNNCVSYWAVVLHLHQLAITAAAAAAVLLRHMLAVDW